MAKRLEVKTMNGSRVTPKTAGIESTYQKNKQKWKNYCVNILMQNSELTRKSQTK